MAHLASAPAGAIRSHVARAAARDVEHVAHPAWQGVSIDARDADLSRSLLARTARADQVTLPHHDVVASPSHRKGVDLALVRNPERATTHDARVVALPVTPALPRKLDLGEEAPVGHGGLACSSGELEHRLRDDLLGWLSVNTETLKLLSLVASMRFAA